MGRHLLHQILAVAVADAAYFAPLPSPSPPCPYGPSLPQARLRTPSWCGRSSAPTWARWWSPSCAPSTASSCGCSGGFWGGGRNHW